ncbi:MAG TPA: S8 family serine peptidase [Vicinamibacterales bacterium]|nr:S8 family serine peptidase [Acidobacteriota bacterium]HOC18686.1 S8 family serine peptidase [Vicinamibacterales bacterium]
MRPSRLLWALVALSLTAPASADDRQSVLVRAKKPYTSVVKSIQKLGGTVTHQYKFVDGLAAEVPRSALPALEALVGAKNIGKDELVTIPESREQLTGYAVEAQTVTPASAVPADYWTSHLYSGASQLFSAGHTGEGVIIAIIDSGFRPLFSHVSAARVLDGASFVPGEPNAKDNANYPHGTQVAGIAAANISFCFADTARFAIEARTLGAGIPGSEGGCPANTINIPMVGTAPLATIYPVKVFPRSGAGSPSSRTLAAMEHVLQQRLDYDAGRGGVNIKVLNMSLGGPTSFAGRTLNDEMVTRLLDADIVTVVSMGNNGSAGITGGSPGTAMAALTVGAASLPQSEWIYRAQFSSPCSTAPADPAILHACATLWRPDTHVQVADYSSRGPTHDGRMKPEIVASGSYSFTQGSGSSTTVNFVLGTSFSSPEVAGVAAALRGAVSGATARQVRNALILTANPSLAPAAEAFDQGHGYLDAVAALAMLRAGGASDTVNLDSKYTRNLQANLDRAGMPVYSGSVSAVETGVLPAERREFAFQVPKNAAKLYVTFRDIVAGASQNTFFGDDLLVMVQGNTVHDDDYRELEEDVTYAVIPAGAQKTFEFDAPSEGIWRITPQGDWTNASPISFGIDIWTTEAALPRHTAKANIGQGQQHAYTLKVPAGTQSLAVRASWLNMNANVPINDLDVYLLPPGGSLVVDCATARTPEACTISEPAAGDWRVIVEGFAVYPESPGGRETYTLRVAADDVVLK